MALFSFQPPKPKIITERKDRGQAFLCFLVLCTSQVTGTHRKKIRNPRLSESTVVVLFGAIGKDLKTLYPSSNSIGAHPSQLSPSSPFLSLTHDDGVTRKLAKRPRSQETKKNKKLI